MKELRLTTTANDAGQRLDRVLSQAAPELSRAALQKAVQAGHCQIDGLPETRANTKVRPGQTIVLSLPETSTTLQAEEGHLELLWQDEHMVVCNKPAGLTVHPCPSCPEQTLVQRLLGRFPQLGKIEGQRPGIVHRLDKDTSGLLVVAKNDAAHHGLSEQFASHGRDGRLERAYKAIVWGVPERNRGTVSASIARSNSNRQKMAVSKSALSREAVTHYEVLENLGKPPLASLLRCALETGRTHQIRVHMTHIGHPLLGDRVYGTSFKASLSTLSEAARNAVNTLNRQALHACVLGFEHPRTGKALRFESPLPADMMQLLAAFTR